MYFIFADQKCLKIVLSNIVIRISNLQFVENGIKKRLIPANRIFSLPTNYPN